MLKVNDGEDKEDSYSRVITASNLYNYISGVSLLFQKFRLATGCLLLAAGL